MFQRGKTWKDEKRERETWPQLLDCRKKCPRSSRNGAHLSLLAARFRSLTVKRRKEAAHETEADPLPMALDFAGLVRTTKRTVDASRKNCMPDGIVLFIARRFRNEFAGKLMKLNSPTVMWILTLLSIKGIFEKQRKFFIILDYKNMKKF